MYEKHTILGKSAVVSLRAMLDTAPCVMIIFQCFTCVHVENIKIKVYFYNSIFLTQDISKGKVGSSDIKESVVIIMGALVHKLCQKGGCNLPVSSAANLL